MGTSVSKAQEGNTQQEARAGAMVPAVVVPVDERHVTIVEPGEEVSVISREEDNHDAGKTYAPDMFELEQHMRGLKEIYSTKFARGILVFANLISIIFACLLIYYGASRGKTITLSDPAQAFEVLGEEVLLLGQLAANKTGASISNMFHEGSSYDQLPQILQPYQLLLGVGISLLFISLMGLLGSCCPSRRVGKEILFGYFSTVLVFVSLLLWASVMCFQYKNETRRLLARTIDDEWETLEPLLETEEGTVMGYIEDNSNLIIAGSFCIVSGVAMIIALWASSKTMGHYFTVRKVLVSCSIAGSFSGMILIGLSVFYGAKNVGGAWAPGVTAVAGAAILLLSWLALYGVKAKSLLALVLHLFLMTLLSLFVAVLGVLTVSYPQALSELLHKHWKDIRYNLTDTTEKYFRQEIADNLLLLGSASILFSILLVVSAAASFATCLEVYRKKKSVMTGTIQITTL